MRQLQYFSSIRLLKYGETEEKYLVCFLFLCSRSKYDRWAHVSVLHSDIKNVSRYLYILSPTNFVY